MSTPTDPANLALASRYRDRMLRQVAHELRGHLASLAFIAALPGAPPALAALDAPIVRLLASLERQRRLLAILDSEGEGAMDLHGCVETCFTLQRARASRAGLVLINGILPLYRGGAPTDGSDLSGALLDALLDNAIRFGVGGDRVEVRPRHDRQPGFEVADRGPGVAPAIAPTLFDPASTRTTPDRDGTRGTGITLALCRDILRARGGELDWTPATPGVVFRVRLPAPG